LSTLKRFMAMNMLFVLLLWGAPRPFGPVCVRS
jgi:hypothetical protein